MTDTASPASRAALVLCLLTSFSCWKKETVIPPRPFQPRLTGSWAWRECTTKRGKGVVAQACEAPAHNPEQDVSRTAEDCYAMNSTHSQAVATLISRPQCTDAAVETLEQLAGGKPAAAVLSDLGTAYFVRAQRADSPVDLLRSLDASRRALQLEPSLDAARFNGALAQEALGFDAEASASWRTIEDAHDGGWSIEAGQHLRALSVRMAEAAAIRWPLSKQRLPEAIAGGDDAAVAQLVEPFPLAAQTYVDEEILPQWADASAHGRSEEAAQQLRIASAIAAQLARLVGDRYLLDDVALINRASTEGDADRLRALQQGHSLFGQARGADKNFRWAEAAKLYTNAADTLARAGSPLADGARLGRASLVFQEKHDCEASTDALVAIERTAAARNYGNLLGRVHATHAYVHFYCSRYVDALAEYDAALAAFERMRDRESIANARIRKVGVLRILGQYDLAWREAIQAWRDASQIVDPQQRHYHLGETAEAALAAGYPDIALLYETRAVDLIQNAMAHAPSGKPSPGLQKNLAIALRSRAEIQMHRAHAAEARQDLDTAMALVQSSEEDAGNRDAFLARAWDVRGQTFLATQPERAVEAFTEALSLAKENEYLTLRAVLYAERAEAHRAAGHREAAEADLRDALAELRREENAQLRKRLHGRNEELWTPYFSRFQETYRKLIQQLIEEQQPAEAFAYAERARAFEPLNLVLQLEQVPASFKQLTQDRDAVDLPRLQQSLPEGTFLIEYCVLRDRTFAWIVSRKDFKPLTLPIREQDIDRWSSDLQRAARRRDVAKFEAGLYEPYVGLLAAPLALIEQMEHGRDPERRLVIVPDRSIHGLPLSALRSRARKRYLIEDMPVSVAGSATLYVFSLLRDQALQSDAFPSALLVGDPAFNRQTPLTRDLPRLPQAEFEVRQIAPLYAPNARILTAEEATVPAFLRGARESTVVHLAAHAVANPRSPFHSLLVLAPSEGDTGLLDAEELLSRLRLARTRLVVLSACSSAGGLPIGPEGLAPLVRPLIAAGSPAVVGSLWDVSNDTSAPLLIAFHQHYRERRDAAVSLQRAQLDLLNSKTRGLRSPLAWAPFQVIGHASSPFPP